MARRPRLRLPRPGLGTTVTIVFVVAALTLTLLRWRGTPDRPLLVAAVGIAPFLVAPGWLLVVHAAVRRRILRLAALLPLLALQVSWVVGDLGGGAEEPSVAHDLRVVTANVFMDNDDQVGAVLELLDADPDVIVLQEIRPETDDELAELAELADYRWRSSTPGPVRRVTLSRLPVTDFRIEWDASANPLIAAVSVADTTVEVANLHLSAPVSNEQTVTWRRQLLDLSAEIHQGQGLRILAGDFNATVHHRPFRVLLDKGLTDAHLAAGSGLDLTWNPGLVVPLMRLDHVLSTEGLQPIRSSILPAIGSDHRPVVVDLRLRPS